VKVVLFGATGMVGQGVLRQCLADAGVTAVLAVGRRPTGLRHPKLREIRHGDMLDLTAIESELGGYDACLFCLGISSVGLTEAQYARVTHDITLTAARTLLRLAPGMSFVYVSAAGSDGTERGRIMWARVRGRTENELLRLPFGHVHCVRLAGLMPLHGIRPRVGWIHGLVLLLWPALRIGRAVSPALVTDSDEFGRAMLALARGRPAPPVVESRDIAALAGAG
jgi:uncharacterized protein YbjT (DUF2867 family)